MRHVSNQNEIILDNLKKRFQSPKDSKLSSFNVVGNDFNSSSFTISSHKDDKKVLVLKYRAARLNEFVSSISDDFDSYLKEIYGDWYKGRTEDDILFEFDTTTLSDQDKGKLLINQLI